MSKIFLFFCVLPFTISYAQEIDFSTPNVNTYGTDPMQGISGKSEFNQAVKRQAEKSYDHGSTSLQKAMEKADAVELKSLKEIQNETQRAETATSTDYQQDATQSNNQPSTQTTTAGEEYDPSTNFMNNTPSSQVVLDRKDYYDVQKEGSYVRKGSKKNLIPFAIIGGFLLVITIIILVNKQIKK